MPAKSIFPLPLAFVLVLSPARAAPGDVDQSFDTGSGIDGAVSAVAVQVDGKVIITGTFGTVNGLVRPGIARLHADGSGDATFNPVTTANDVYYRTFLQPDSKVLVTGDFATANGVDRTSVVRLNADGSRDGGFNAAVAAGVGQIVLQPDGKILAGGRFTTANGPDFVMTARLNPDGSLDSSFVSASGGTVVLALALQPDGKVIIGGQFTTINGTAQNGIARLHANGSLDTSFIPVASTTRNVNSIALQPDGKVLLGGPQSTPATGSRHVVRLHANGSMDSSFSSQIGAVWIRALTLQPDGKLLIGGKFTTVDTISRNNIARLNASGSLDSSFNPGTGTNTEVNRVILQTDGKLLIAGAFAAVNGTARPFLARLNANGSLDPVLNPASGIHGPSGAHVRSIAVQPNGKVLIGGWFTTVGDGTHNGIVRLNHDGSLDTNFEANVFETVLALVAQPDGKVLIGGKFSNIENVSRNNIARLNADGTLDGTFDPGSGTSNVVSSLALQPDGKVLIGGVFGTVNGFSRSGFARLNANGSLDAPFASGTFAGDAGSVYAIAIQPDGRIIRGGQNFAGVHATGNLDTTFDPGTGPDGFVYSVVLQADSKVLIGGSFGNYNNIARAGIARLHADATLDDTFDPGLDGGVYSLVLQPDGKVLVGGGFATAHGTRHLARLNSDGSLDGSFDAGIIAGGFESTSVNSVAVQVDGSVVIGGNFTMADGMARWRVARLLGDDVTPPLDIALSSGSVTLSWPEIADAWRLEETPDLTLPNAWTAVAQSAVTNAGRIAVTVPIVTPRRYFRLIPR